MSAEAATAHYKNQWLGTQNRGLLLQLVFIRRRRQRGMGRFQQPASARIIRVMCSGRIDPLHVFNAFLEGADAVLVTGCHIGDCHYVNGNDKTKIKYKYLENVAHELGIEKERLQLNWISASEGEKFANFIRDVTAQIKKLGPSPLKPEGVA